MPVKNYSELIVWQKAMDLATAVYEVTKAFPREEQYGLASQLKRAVVSISCNIAEGQGRRTTKDFVHYLYTANGSLRETETQIVLAFRLGFMPAERHKELMDRCAEVGRILYGLIHSLERIEPIE